MSVHLILGGVRAGKSAYALAQAEASTARTGGRLVFIATAQAHDDEMSDRIARHRAERGAHWRTVEEPLALAQALDALEADEVAVVDCLTLWLSNSMLAEDGSHAARLQALPAALVRRAGGGASFVVSNEVGWGVVPDTPLGRRFRDDAGRLHQAVAAVAQTVTLVVAGLPLTLKGEKG